MRRIFYLVCGGGEGEIGFDAGGLEGGGDGGHEEALGGEDGRGGQGGASGRQV